MKKSKNKLSLSFPRIESTGDEISNREHNPKEDIKLSYSFAETLNKGGCCQGSVWIDASDYLPRGEELGTLKFCLVGSWETQPDHSLSLYKSWRLGLRWHRV